MNSVKIASIEQQSTDPNKVFITIEPEQGRKISFLLKVELINYIVINEQKNLNIHISFKDRSEEVFVCNFGSLIPAYNRPIIKKSSSIKTEEESLNGAADLVTYAISQKEFNNDGYLFLSKGGWVKQKKFFQSAIKEGKIERIFRKCINPSCGKDIKIGSNFCPFCGAKQQDLTGQLKLCSNPSCNKEIVIQAQYCPYCGVKQDK